jgi:hypothetical protein
VEVAIVGKITVHLWPTVPVSLIEVSHVVVDVGVPGGASGNFQSRVSTISLQAAVHSWASVAGALPEEEEEPLDTCFTVTH